MVLVLALSSRIARLVIGSLGGAKVVSARSWTQAYDHAVRAEVLVVAADDLQRDVAAADIYAFRRRAMFLPVLAAVPHTRGNSEWLAAVAVGGVVWADDLTGLPKAIEGATATSSVLRLASMLLLDSRVPRSLSGALSAACRAGPPFPGIKELAAMTHQSVRALELAFRVGIDRSTGITAVRVIHWLELLWAADRLRAGARRTTVAGALGINQRTLERRSIRLAGVSLGEIRTISANTLLTKAVDGLGVGRLESVVSR